jgi:uncharacterized protein (DUF3084 family)
MRQLVLISYGVIAEGIRNILDRTNQLRFTSKPDYRYLERMLQQIKTTRNKAREELQKDPDQVKQVRKEGRNIQISK